MRFIYAVLALLSLGACHPQAKDSETSNRKATTKEAEAEPQSPLPADGGAAIDLTGIWADACYDDDDGGPYATFFSFSGNRFKAVTRFGDADATCVDEAFTTRVTYVAEGTFVIEGPAKRAGAYNIRYKNESVTATVSSEGVTDSRDDAGYCGRTGSYDEPIDLLGSDCVADLGTVAVQDDLFTWETAVRTTGRSPRLPLSDSSAR